MKEATIELSVKIKAGSSVIHSALYTNTADCNASPLSGAHPKHVLDGLFEDLLVALDRQFHIDQETVDQCWEVIGELKKLDPRFNLHVTRWIDCHPKQALEGLKESLEWMKKRKTDGDSSSIAE